MRKSIQIDAKTKERLAKHGTLSGTFDTVINFILDHVEKCDAYPQPTSLGEKYDV